MKCPMPRTYKQEMLATEDIVALYDDARRRAFTNADSWQDGAYACSYPADGHAIDDGLMISSAKCQMTQTSA